MKRIVIITLLSVFSAAWGFAQVDLQPAAIVNLIRSEPITVRQLRIEVQNMERATGRTLTESQRREVLDVMINERLVLQAAERDRVTLTDNELNQQINQLRAQLTQMLGRPPTDAEFAEAVRNETGLELPAFREQMRRQLTAQKYLLSQKQSQIESNLRVPTEDEILSAYNLTRSQFVRPDTVRFSMIQVPYGPDAASRTRARQQIDELAREIGTSVARFDAVVVRSQAPNSGINAGDAGFLPRNMEARAVVGPAFMDIAFSLRSGEISGVIEGIPGFQIIRITESHTMKNLELNDIAQLGTNMTVRDFIGNTIMQERQQVALTQATEELVAELRSGRTFQVFENNLRW